MVYTSEKKVYLKLSEWRHFENKLLVFRFLF
jgi:hypothetical protein